MLAPLLSDLRETTQPPCFHFFTYKMEMKALDCFSMRVQLDNIQKSPGQCVALGKCSVLILSLFFLRRLKSI